MMLAPGWLMPGPNVTTDVRTGTAPSRRLHRNKMKMPGAKAIRRDLGRSSASHNGHTCLCPSDIAPS
jgi:hypothetical protein